MEVSYLEPKDVKEFSELALQIISQTTYYSPLALETEMKKFIPLVILEKLKDKNYLFCVLKNQNKILGFSSGYFDLGTFWIDWIGSAPSFRRSGVASQLLAFQEKYLQTQGVHKIWFDTRTENKESLALFEKLGFRKICFLEKHWYEQDFYLWEKFL